MTLDEWVGKESFGLGCEVSTILGIWHIPALPISALCDHCVSTIFDNEFGE